MLKLIGIEEETKNRLDILKEHPRETYEDVINRLIKYYQESKKEANEK